MKTFVTGFLVPESGKIIIVVNGKEIEIEVKQNDKVELFLQSAKL